MMSNFFKDNAIWLSGLALLVLVLVVGAWFFFGWSGGTADLDSGDDLLAQVVKERTYNPECRSSDEKATAVPKSLVLRAESLVPESYEYSFQQGTAASKLVDGNDEFFAYPGYNEVDYVVDMGAPHELKKIIIVWGFFGEKDIYVNKWILDGCKNTGNWAEIASGGFPNSRESKIAIGGDAYSKLRLRAFSREWIGVNELKVE